MKTSELIDKLNKIAKTVPFDADIVTGDDWLWQGVDKVYHNPRILTFSFIPTTRIYGVMMGKIGAEHR